MSILEADSVPPEALSPQDFGSNMPLPKKQFSIEEDRFVVLFVAAHGLKSWALLARQMKNRTPKQCRERWHNHLNPQINRGPWSFEEDRILALKHRDIGNHWAEIAKHLPGRTDTLVKNRWNTSVKARLDELQLDIRPTSIAQKDLPMSWSPKSMMEFAVIPPFVFHRQ
jgi:hypothetical protein